MNMSWLFSFVASSSPSLRSTISWCILIEHGTKRRDNPSWTSFPFVIEATAKKRCELLIRQEIKVFGASINLLFCSRYNHRRQLSELKKPNISLSVHRRDAVEIESSQSDDNGKHVLDVWIAESLSAKLFKFDLVNVSATTDASCLAERGEASLLLFWLCRHTTHTWSERSDVFHGK